MYKRLHSKLAVLIIAIAAGILLISTVSIILAAHYHLKMYTHQTPDRTLDLPQLDYHLEQALLQSILWTFAGSIMLAIFIGFYTARRISRPLVDMKHAAEQMTKGNLDTRIVIQGQDELAGLGTSLNKLAEQLQTQNQLRITMTGDIAHELRTPLTTLKSHMRAFEDGVWEPTPSRLHSCYEEIERLTRMVFELEDLAHMESPEFQLERCREELRPIIERVVGLVTAAYLERKIELSLNCAPGIYLSVDRGRMIQILVNLLTNALKFTPDVGKVSIRVAEEAQGVLLRVEDTGSGIAPEDLPFIFERFYRGDRSRARKTGGSGLGLTIVKKLVLAHGGEIRAESLPGEGAAFLILLPK